MLPLYHLSYPLPLDELKAEAEKAKLSAQAYQDSRWPGWSADDWLIAHHSSVLIDTIMDDFNVNGKARFYWLEAGSQINTHCDRDTLCSLNFILSEDPAPITICGIDYQYRSALLDTTKPHSVQNGKDERLLLKISIFDYTFKKTLNRIPKEWK